MSKVMIGLVLGALLGGIDGWCARFYDMVDPGEYMGILAGSTGKGLITGLVAGLVARKKDSISAGVVAGLLTGLVLSGIIGYLNEMEKPGTFWPIVLPGTALGAIVGFAAQHYGRKPAPTG